MGESTVTLTGDSRLVIPSLLQRRQRREFRKEKEFQAGLIAQIKQAEAFSAERYVAEKIEKATAIQIPRFWKGKRLPEFVIRQKLGLPPKE